MVIRKLGNYKPTIFKADQSYYDKDAADMAVNFINCLKHTKGEWFGKNFGLVDWQEQIIRDMFGTGYRIDDETLIVRSGPFKSTSWRGV